MNQSERTVVITNIGDLKLEPPVVVPPGHRLFIGSQELEIVQEQVRKDEE